MNKYDISIIIPTHNRAVFLKETLSRFDNQTLDRRNFEVIVADDGSTDNTEGAVRLMRGNVSYRLNYIKQPKAGPASARNKAARQAEGEIALFTGDDIFPKEDMLEEHLKSHRLYKGIAVLGCVDWSAGIDITDFMRHVAPDGFQFRYNAIKNPDNCGFRYFYTSNISLPRALMGADPFDEDFPFGALEDTELAYRLQKKGLRIVLNRNAIGYHCHPMTVDSFCRRMKSVGLSAAVLIKKHPELKRMFLPVNLPAVSAGFSALKKFQFLRGVLRKPYWDIQIIASYLEGLKEGYSNENKKGGSK